VSDVLSAGIHRVVIGTSAVEVPALVTDAARRWPERIAVGLDHRNGEVRIRGWTEGSGRRVADLIPLAVDAGASAIVVTDIGRDGRLAGPDVAGLAELLEATGAPIIASGGVRDLDDIGALAEVSGGTADRASARGLVGVIAGRAIYEGRLDVVRAIQFLASVQARP
jgi:phosphoribosylformimino-5-aminoimidazole carboxamide ribotide isomerase